MTTPTFVFTENIALALITAGSTLVGAIFGYLNNRVNHRIEDHTKETKAMVKAALPSPPDETRKD